MVPIISWIVREFRFARKIRRDCDGTLVKVDHHNFSRIGSDFLFVGDVAKTSEHVQANLRYVRLEIGRWHRSMAFTTDLVVPLDEDLQSADALWDAIEKSLSDTNAADINTILVRFLDRLAGSACCVVRNMVVYHEVSATWLLAIAEACEQFEPFCADQHMLMDVRMVAYAPKMVLPRWRNTKACKNMKWSDAEMEAWVKMVKDDIRKRGNAEKASAAGGDDA